MKIQFYIKVSYGVKRAYFVDDTIAAAWKRLTNQASFTPKDMQDMKIMGLEFEKVELEGDGFDDDEEIAS